MYYRVIPFAKTFDTFGLTYKIPDRYISEIVPGKLVTIPLKNTQELGLLMWEVHEQDIDYDISSIKEIEDYISDTVFLSDEQRSIVDFIANCYITPIHNAVSLFFPRNLKEKIAKWTFEKVKKKQYEYLKSSLVLSEAQQEIYTKISKSQNKKHLIYWVTGSGKTQIYMKIIEDNLKLWKQTLLLIPEIILTSQIGERLKKQFWGEVLLLHSGVSEAKKTLYWKHIYSDEAKIIVWTRSSLFYPYNNLWAIIIDEEHDSSYISDSAPRYHTLEVAEKLSELYRIPLVLWSGTPRATTMYRGLTWEFQLLQLLKKYTD